MTTDRLGLSSDERGVSETVGFVLVIAIVTTTIAVTFTVGLSGLNDAQIAERDNNVERAFDVLQNNLGDISEDGVPSRSTELKLAGGQLAFGESTEVRLHSDGWAGDGWYNTTTQPIVYSGDGETEILYENGAVFRTEAGGGVMLTEPNLLVGDTVVYSITEIRGSNRALGGDRTVLVVGERTDRAVADRNQSVESVTMEIESPRAEIWAEQYRETDERLSEDENDLIENVTLVDDDSDAEFVRVEFDLGGSTDRFVVHWTRVNVEFRD